MTRRKKHEPRVGASRRARYELTPGVVVGGRYLLERRVASGGMGEVWAALHLTLSQQKALMLEMEIATFGADEAPPQ